MLRRLEPLILVVVAAATAACAGDARVTRAAGGRLETYRVTTDLEKIIGEVTDRPVAVALSAAAVVLWAILALRAFPPLFKTCELTFRGARNAVAQILIFLAVLVLLGHGLELVWEKITWSPRAEIGVEGEAAVAWVLYALVPLAVLHKRLGVRLGQALVLTALWLALIAAAIAGLWIFAVPYLELLV